MSPIRFEAPEALDALDTEDYLLLSAIVLLPLAFGGVELWAYRGASLLIAVAACVALGRSGWIGLGLGRQTRWLLPAFLLGAWGLAQLIPLPPALLRVLSPQAYATYAETFPGFPGEAPAELAPAIEEMALALVAEAGAVTAPAGDERFFDTAPPGRWAGWRPLSLLPGAGVERFFWYAALLLAFLLARRRLADAERFHAYRNALFGLFVGLGAFGLIYAATANGKLYWIRPLRDELMPAGPYVNPTNFAAVMEMAVPWLAGYAWLTARRLGIGWRGVLRTPIFSAGTAVCLAAGLAAASKFAAVMLALGIFVLALAGTRGARNKVLVLVAGLVVVVSGALVLGESRLGERVDAFLQSTDDLESINRWVALEAAVPMIRDYPITGSGFGSFREVYGRYLHPGEFLVWEQLHNDYVEVVAEGGVVTAVLLLWLVAAFWIRILRPRSWRTSRGLDLEYLGLVIGIACLFAHAAVDFNHQIPGNALLFVALSAFAVSRAESGPEQASEVAPEVSPSSTARLAEGAP